ncbi:MAG: ATP-binding protein [Lachnospiraceae bacterium]|nr:ATP-binding protein [Lachnospiraceae bacterium]
MSLTNTQYDSIINKYSKNRLIADRILEDRKKEIYKKIPEYKELDDLIITVSIQKGRDIISGQTDSVGELEDVIDSLIARKKLLLTEAGYPIGYLDSFYFCPECKDTGFVNGEKCSCFVQAEWDLLYDQLNLKDNIRVDTFDSVCYDYYSGENLTRLENAVNVCKDFVETFEEAHKSILLNGPVGTGKTFLTNCVVNALITKGFSCIYFSSIDLFDKLSRFQFDKEAKEKMADPMEDISRCDLLIIDDLGTELTNSFTQSCLFSILETRQKNGKSTLISTNSDLKDLRDRYDDRIFSRIYSNFEVCKLSGEDVRILKKQMSKRK